MCQILKLTMNTIVFFKRLESSSNLEADWRYNCWSLDELDQILSKINKGLEVLNPNFFFGKEIGYIDHVKSWYLLQFVLL